MAVNANADDYAAGRQGIFFPANNQTPADGNLTGQCVTLNKWFLAEMTSVPSPFAARGDARYVGDNLVAQGHAVEVPYDQRRRGDFVVYKYGTYGHIGVLLSGDRLFESNVNVGVARRWVDGAYVYAARIGTLGESWRPVKPNIYRIKTYVEQGGNMAGIPNASNWYWRMNKLMSQIRGRGISQAEFEKNFVGTDPFRMVEILSDDKEADQANADQSLGQLARRDNWQGQIYTLQGIVDGTAKALAQANTDLAAARTQLQELGSRPTKAQLDAVTTQLQAAEGAAAKAHSDYVAASTELEKLRQQEAADKAAGDNFLRRLGQLIAKYWPGGK